MPAAKAVMRLARLDGLLAPSLAESLPIRNGRPLHLRPHLARLAEGCLALGWRGPDQARLARLCREAARRNGLKTAGLRARYWGGLDSPAILLQVLAARPMPKGGIRLMTSAVRHYGPDALGARAKAAQMLPNWLAIAETRAWAEDGLRLTPDGFVAEGVWSNVVAVKGMLARTPPLHQGLLEGVTRARLLARLRRRGLTVRQEPLTRYDLWTADAVWMTSSLRGPVRVASVDGREIGHA